jgi:hypothetical protein
MAGSGGLPATGQKEGETMKRLILIAVVLALALGFGAKLAAGEEEAIEGTLVAAKCYLVMGELGNDHMGVKDCGTKCAKAGNPVGLVTADGKYYPLVVASPLVADHVGQKLRASGKLMSGSFVPDKLERKKEDSWEEIKIATS